MEVSYSQVDAGSGQRVRIELPVNNGQMLSTSKRIKRMVELQQSDLMIPVTKPYLPSIDKYQKYVADIYRRQWLTNNGPLVNEFEWKLKEKLTLDHLLYVTNGTIALQIAIKALNLKGEIITTPFSYVATTSSIVWEGCEPVFVDIDEATLNIDPSKIEKAVTSKTSAILATHCFGNPCSIDEIQAVADKHDLKVIYDAAHCFGTEYNGRCIFEFGDISTSSLHATKLMHSVEGGLVVTKDPDLLKSMAYMRNFGHDGPEKFNGIGINGKNSEFHAAMGLCVLEDIDEILLKRKELSALYDQTLANLNIRGIKLNSNGVFNYAYYPLVFKSESDLLAVKKALELVEIFSRRYFFPSLSKLSYVKASKTPISDNTAKRVLCLPLYFDLTLEEVYLIARIITRTLKNGISQ